MNIKLHEISIQEVYKGYKNSFEEGVVAYNGFLNIRPKYQREFVYTDKQQKSVIDTVIKSFPLNVMYWVKNEETSFEVLDGQQRTMSICEFIEGNFSIDKDGNPLYFHNMTNDEQQQILNYKLMIYFCEGTDSEKLSWFKTINIAGEKLTDQELRNAVYTGSWLSDAKRYFSKSNSPAYNISSDYLTGIPIRQEYLETAIKWISNDNIELYMANNQKEPNANELWLYFNAVINWIKILFPNYRKEMKGIDWGSLYNQYKDNKFDSTSLEKDIVILMQDEDVTNKKGIYLYLITNNQKYLSIRAFTDKQKREAFERQKGFCIKCSNVFSLSEMEADHITPWSEGGKTILDNCQMLCKNCNRIKSNK